MHTCPFCGAGSDYDPAAPAPEPAESGPAPQHNNAPTLNNAPPVIRPPPIHRPEMVVMGDAVPRGDGFRFPWGFLLVLVAIGAAVTYSLMPKRLDISMLEPYDPVATFCQKKATCVVAYVAPWCPASRTSLRMIAQFREQLEADGIGLAVVIGNDDGDRSRQVADLVGETAWIDRGDLLLKRMDIETLPTWFRLDGDLKVRERVDGTFRPMDYNLEKLGIYAAAP